MLRWRQVEISGGFLLVAALLFYLDTENLLFWAAAACALHELGHGLAIRCLGGRVALLRLTCVGAELKLSARYPMGYGRQLLAALGGPAANLLCAGAAVHMAGGGDERAYLFAGLNLALAGFNLLPAAPLDGGRCLWCLLALLETEEKAERIVAATSSAVSLALTLGSLLLTLRGQANLTLLITALWLLLSPWTARRGGARARG